jgi:hypothetical protein
MVDRKARHIAALVVRQFIDGSITNDEYERKFPMSKEDPALRAIYHWLWPYYSDLCEHTLTGKHTLSNEQRALFDRCFLFLSGDLEFQWPVPAFGLRYGMIRLLGFGWLLKRREKKEMSIGDIEVWPFLKKSHYEEALRKSQCPTNS